MSHNPTNVHLHAQAAKVTAASATWPWSGLTSMQLFAAMSSYLSDGCVLVGQGFVTVFAVSVLL